MSLPSSLRSSFPSEQGRDEGQRTMPINIDIDWEHRKVRFMVSGNITDSEFDQSVGAAMRGRPEITAFDAVVDLMAYEGDVTADQVAALASDINRIRPKNGPLVRTAFVTRDAHFAIWMKAMTFQFEGREFRMFATADAADAWVMADHDAT